MGGFGSGRYSYASTPSCESTHSIDLASLRRRGMLKPGGYSLAWSCRGEPAGSISIVAQTDGVRLLYRVTGPKGERISANEFVPFGYTHTRFGGRRQWLTCLRCGRRCLRIFAGPPKGNKNALKHGRYTAQAIARRRELRALLQGIKQLADEAF
jgi:hypothetical protein